MPRSNGVAIRDERGRYLKGMPGGPGRPLGSRNKLTEDFLGDCTPLGWNVDAR
jgi:hypothetical protein